jgi:hypothetical protein
MRQQAYCREVADCHGRQHAMRDLPGGRPRTNCDHIGRKLPGIEVAVRVNPEGHCGVGVKKGEGARRREKARY